MTRALRCTPQDKVKNESFRSIEAQTDIATERYVGTVVKDHADLTNVKWRQSGDIRDDLTTGLDARWFLYKQGDGDVKTDKKIFTGDYKHLTSGQTEAYGPEQKMDEVGDYYWVIEISDPSTITRSSSWEPSETRVNRSASLRLPPKLRWHSRSTSRPRTP